MTSLLMLILPSLAAAQFDITSEAIETPVIILEQREGRDIKQVIHRYAGIPKDGKVCNPTVRDRENSCAEVKLTIRHVYTGYIPIIPSYDTVSIDFKDGAPIYYIPQD